MNDKYIFIDRDGVINADGDGITEHGYITRWEDFHFLPGVLDAFRTAAERGFRCVIISNQQGVSKGYHTPEELSVITQKMISAINETGGDIAGVYYCTHSKEEGCSCRKPKTGLFLKAQKELGIKEMSGKYYIGDAQRDVRAGKNAGLRTILVLSGKTNAKETDEWEFKPDHICEDLPKAIDLITKPLDVARGRETT